MKRKLQVMKFGGTSVGDAGCIARSARIVAEAGQGNAVVAVVSAMSGGTNRLVEAANRAGNGDREAGTALIGELRRQHETALASIVSSKGLVGVAPAGTASAITPPSITSPPSHPLPKIARGFFSHTLIDRPTHGFWGRRSDGIRLGKR